MALALVSQVHNRFGRAQRAAGGSFAEALFRKWSLGSRQCQAGLLIAVEQHSLQACPPPPPPPPWGQAST